MIYIPLETGQKGEGRERQYLTKGQSGRLEAIIVDQVRSHSAVTQPVGRVCGVPVCPDDERGHFLIRAAPNTETLQHFLNNRP